VDRLEEGLSAVDPRGDEVDLIADEKEADMTRILEDPDRRPLVMTTDAEIRFVAPRPGSTSEMTAAAPTTNT